MIGVVGPSDAAEELVGRLDGNAVEIGSAADVLAADPEVVLAVGDAALRSLVAAAAPVPVLPVETDAGLEPVAAERAPAVVEAGRESDFETRSNPVLAVAVDGEPAGRALFDAMLVTREPARISEYAVETAGGTDRYRADGVVVATPAGSRGYARAVGGPVLDPAAAGLAVVPVAAFAVRASTRVAGAEEPVVLRVERDEGDIELLVDGTVVREVPTRRPVTVRAAGALETVVDPGA